MALGLYQPHNPRTTPKRFFEMYPLENVQLPKILEGDLKDIPEIGQRWAKERLILKRLKKQTNENPLSDLI